MICTGKLYGKHGSVNDIKTVLRLTNSNDFPLRLQKMYTKS